jgi:uncharacterized membrane protein
LVGFSLLFGLIGLGIPAAIIYLLISNAGLLRRVGGLEEELKRLKAVLERDQSRTAQAAQTPKTQEQPAPSPPQASPQAVTQPEFRATIPNPDYKPPETAAQTPYTPKAYVLKPSTFEKLGAWLSQNWFYAVSAVSLALAGVFLVQYGIEKGLLPPLVRVLAALGFGALLIGAGEYIRRRFSDSQGSTAYLPSTFSSAGIVTLFAAILSARALYGLIEPQVALLAMGVVGLGAIALGWLYGPLLAAIGVIGSMAAPFLVGGSSTDASWLFAFFAIITATGLAIDTLRQWAWVSVISLVLGFAAATFLILLGPAGTSDAAFMVYCTFLAIIAIAIPVQRLLPNHGGSNIFVRNWDVKDTAPWPQFPVGVAAGSLLAASGLILLTLVRTDGTDLYWLGFGLLTGLAFALMIWAQRAPGLADTVIIPAIAMVATVPIGTPIWRAQVTAWQGPDGTLPLAATALVAIGITLSLVATWRSLKGDALASFFAVLATLIAPALAIALEVFWKPGNAFASYGWALHALIIAIFMTGIAERFHRADGHAERLRVSVAALSGIAAIAFAMVILFSSAALTIALAITVLAAAALDRKFNLPAMSVYIMAGVAAVMYRLSFDPGLAWAVDAPLFEMLLSYAGAVIAFAAAWYVMRGWNRPGAFIVLDSAVFSALGILLSLLLYRAVVHWAGDAAVDSHWSIGVGATIWILLGLAQWRRMDAEGLLKQVREGLGALFLLIGCASLAGGLLIANPLITEGKGAVLGLPVLSSLLAAYLLPAAAVFAGRVWLKALASTVRHAFTIIAAGLAVLWLGMTIRHAWQGPEGMPLPGVKEGELYSYTVALLLIGAGLMYQSLARSSAATRKAGLVVIGLAVAKVFLIDISGLEGLTRVFSLLALGLSLAGLAWLNRWVAGTIAASDDESSEGSR